MRIEIVKGAIVFGPVYDDYDHMDTPNYSTENPEFPSNVFKGSFYFIDFQI